MENRIYNGQNGLWYELQGDYYIPCIALSDEEQVEIGVWDTTPQGAICQSADKR